MRSLRSGSGRDAVPEIKGEFEHLRWLLTYIRHRQGSTNFRRRVSISPTPTSSTKSDGEEPDQEDIFEEEEYREDMESRPMEIETQQTQNEIDDGHEQGVQESMNVNVIDVSKNNVSTPTSSISSISTGITRPRPTKNQNSKNSKQKIIASKTNKPWSKAPQTPTGANEMDKEFLKAVHSLKSAIEEPQNADDNEVDDDRHFCLSLVGQVQVDGQTSNNESFQ